MMMTELRSKLHLDLAAFRPRRNARIVSTYFHDALVRSYLGKACYGIRMSRYKSI